MPAPKASPWPFVGIGALACLFFLYGASILFLPWWVVVLLYVAWLVLMVRAGQWFTSRPRGTVVLAAVGWALWLIAVGGAALAAAAGG